MLRTTGLCVCVCVCFRPNDSVVCARFRRTTHFGGTTFGDHSTIRRVSRGHTGSGAICNTLFHPSCLDNLFSRLQSTPLEYTSDIQRGRSRGGLPPVPEALYQGTLWVRRQYLRRNFGVLTLRKWFNPTPFPSPTHEKHVHTYLNKRLHYTLWYCCSMHCCRVR